MELTRQTVHTHLTQHPHNMRYTHSANGSTKLNNYTFMYACHVLQQTAHQHVITHICAHTHALVSSVRDGTRLLCYVCCYVGGGGKGGGEGWGAARVVKAGCFDVRVVV